MANEIKTEDMMPDENSSTPKKGKKTSDSPKKETKKSNSSKSDSSKKKQSNKSSKSEKSTTTKKVDKAAESKPAKEKPAKKEPAKEKPAKEKPAKKEPAKKEPAKEKPAKEKPAKEKPAKEKPAKEKPAKKEPAKKEPAKEKPAKEKSAKKEPAKEKPAKEKPAKEKPAKKEPAKEKPAKKEPAKEKPAEEAAPPITLEERERPGKDIEPFVEPLKQPDIEIEVKDEKVSAPVDTYIKPLPRFLSHFVPVQGDGISEVIRKGIVVISVVLLIVSMVTLIDSTRSEEFDEEPSSNVLLAYSESFELNAKSKELSDDVLEKYYPLYNLNSDVVGWLTLPDTPIDIPVVQGNDNRKYKTTGFNGEKLSGLIAYADYSCKMDILDTRTIMYVSTGSNYGDINGLDAYEDSAEHDDAQEMRTLEFGTLYNDYDWEIIACILSSNLDTDIPKLCVENNNDFKDYLLENTIYEKSLINIKSSDKVLILSVPYEDDYLIFVSKLLNQQPDDR